MITRAHSSLLRVAVAFASCVWSASGLAEEAAPGHEHDAHRAAMQRPAAYLRTEAAYTVPAVILVNQRNEPVSLPAAVEGGAPVALNFIFTTCNTICPVMTATFARLRQALGPDAAGLRMLSISIDPEHDTPQALKEYGGRYGVDADWQLLTGEADRITAVLRAFDAFAGSKTNHQPLTFFHVPGRREWVRVKGLASAADLASEYRRLRQDRAAR